MESLIASKGRIVVLKRIAALLALSGVALGLAACNTIEGAGKDVKATGSAIEKAADSAKPK
jgi:predicted small secreted protein